MEMRGCFPHPVIRSIVSEIENCRGLTALATGNTSVSSGYCRTAYKPGSAAPGLTTLSCRRSAKIAYKWLPAGGEGWDELTRDRGRELLEEADRLETT